MLNTISPDMGARFDDFKKCLISEKEGGATSDYYILLNAGVTDPEGNRYNYHLHNKGMIDSVLSAGTYLDLVQALQHESEVEFSSYLTSIRTVIGALQPLHKNLRGNCSQTSYPLANLCGALPISETTTIGDLQLDPEQVKRQLNANAHNFKSKRNDDAKFPSFAMLRIDESTPLWKLIERVESVLEGVK
ncbi:MAG: hypothetical protein IPN69_18190 [Acidobacteria bacterium]|nr:hypothetical protein [Acidobacteriota bacterium]